MQTALQQIRLFCFILTLSCLYQHLCARPALVFQYKGEAPGAKKIYNKAGDIILLSKDKFRRIRFDYKRPHPHKNPHAHVEQFINGKWKKSKPIYPKDVPHN